MTYQVLTDQYIDGLLVGTNFGEPINNSTTLKREEIKKSLRNQLNGFWTGRTMYSILIKGGFLKDAKFGEKKELTELGAAFLTTNTCTE